MFVWKRTKVNNTKISQFCYNLENDNDKLWIVKHIMFFEKKSKKASFAWQKKLVLNPTKEFIYQNNITVSFQ